MKRIITIVLLSIPLMGFSQQEPQFSMFWNNYSLFNPANTGVNNEHYANSTYRTSYVGIENSPQTITANYENKIDKYNSGVGLGYSFEKIGLGKSQKVYLNYAYHLKLPNINGTISGGVSADYQRMKFSPLWNGSTTGSNSSLDPSLPTGISGGTMNINTGLLFKTEKLELGVSLTQINEAVIEKVYFTNARHIFGMVSYKIQLIDDLIYKPIVYFKSDFVAGIVELNNQFILKEKYFLGLMYRHTDAVGIQLGITFLKNFQVAYGYDLLTGPLAAYANGGSHEVALTFKLK